HDITIQTDADEIHDVAANSRYVFIAGGTDGFFVYDRDDYDLVHSRTSSPVTDVRAVDATDHYVSFAQGDGIVRHLENGTWDDEGTTDVTGANTGDNVIAIEYAPTSGNTEGGLAMAAADGTVRAAFQDDWSPQTIRTGGSGGDAALDLAWQPDGNYRDDPLAGSYLLVALDQDRVGIYDYDDPDWSNPGSESTFARSVAWQGEVTTTGDNNVTVGANTGIETYRFNVSDEDLDSGPTNASDEPVEAVEYLDDIGADGSLERLAWTDGAAVKLSDGNESYDVYKEYGFDWIDFPSDEPTAIEWANETTDNGDTVDPRRMYVGDSTGRLSLFTDHEADTDSVKIRLDDWPETMSGDEQADINVTAVFENGSTEDVTDEADIDVDDTSVLQVVDGDTLQAQGTTGATSITATWNGHANFTAVAVDAGQFVPAWTDASPRNLNYVNDTTPTLEIRPDFNDYTGDLNVSFWVYNESSERFEFDSNETVDNGDLAESDPIDTEGGIVQWHAQTTVQNATLNSSAYQFRSPANVTVVNASDDSLLDDVQVNYTVVGQDSSQIFTGSTGDGSFRLDPDEDEPVRIDLDADGYHDQRIYWDDPAANVIIPMYPLGSEDIYNQSFELEDQTGNFPPESTRLIAERVIDGEWQPVQARYFGGSNNATLQVTDGETYRLRVANDAGNIRTIEEWTADEDEYGNRTITLTVSERDFDPIDQTGFTWSVSWAEEGDDELAHPRIYVDFDLEADTEFNDLRIDIRSQDGDVVVRDNVSYGYVESSLSMSVAPPEADNHTWVVSYWAQDAETGEIYTGSQLVGDVVLDPDLPIDAGWLEIVSVLMLILTAGIFGGIRADIGAMAVAVVGALLYVLGWLPESTNIGLVILALAVGGLVFVRQRGFGGGVR
ncbi:MAG: hypothetical protein ACOCR0_01215, partial [Haloferacaceae archaeon]